jgi:hypothetical protein
LVDVVGLQIGVAALPTDEVPGHHEGKDAQAGSAAPVDGRIAKEEILDD